MVTPTAPRKAEAGIQGSLDWLEMKIIECLVKPMDEDNAKCLAVYETALQSIKGHDSRLATFEIQTNDNINEHISMKEAEQWCNGMKNADGTTGPHWPLSQSKQIQAKYGIGVPPSVFFSAINATYSELCEFFRKHNISTVDTYVEFVKSFWIDGTPFDKVTAYYNSVINL